MGYRTDAIGAGSAALGYRTDAIGDFATALGYLSIASGERSTAMGQWTIAPSAYETTVGMFNTTYTPASTTTIDPTDRLFVVGNGTNSTLRSDAMVILKNGNVGIGNSDPEGQLFVQQTSTASGGSSGIFVDRLGDNWKTYHSGLHYSFANEGTRYAYVEDNTGNYVITSDKNLKQTLPRYLVSWKACFALIQ